MTKKDIQHQL